MIRSYHSQEIATISSVLIIEFAANMVVLEYQIATKDYNEDNSSIFLCFNPKQTRTLYKHYKTDNIEDLFDSIHQHFTTYNSLRRYQDFLDTRGINSTISSSCALSD